MAKYRRRNQQRWRNGGNGENAAWRRKSASISRRQAAKIKKKRRKWRSESERKWHGMAWQRRQSRKTASLAQYGE